MATEHVVHALVRKYAELAGTLKKLNEETARVADELNHVRATILIFQPDYRIRAIVPKRPKKPSAYGSRGAHGGLMRTVMDALRQSPAAITARDLAEQVLTARGVMEPGAERLKLTTRAVNISLASLQKRGLAVSDGDMPRRWSLARDG